jgi:hypothetical protein
MAEDNEERFKVPLFDGNNYENWKFRMECFFDEKGLLTLVKSEPVYEECARRKCTTASGPTTKKRRTSEEG